MNFPEWAPPRLVEDYQNYFGKQDTHSHWRKEREREILIAITTNPEMKSVWKMLYKKRVLYKREEHEPASFGNNLMAFLLHQAIVRAIGETKQKITSRSDDVLKYQEIAKAAKKLIEKVKGSSLDFSPPHWFPSEAINTMLMMDVNPDKAAGYFCLVHDEGDLHKKGGIYHEVRLKDLSGNDIFEYWRIAENTIEFFNNHVITPQYPSISEILKGVASEADTVAKHEETRTRIVNKATISKTTIFIRALYPFWLETFGGPLYRTFAALCRVVLDDISIDEDNIKDALKNYKISI